MFLRNAFSSSMVLIVGAVLLISVFSVVDASAKKNETIASYQANAIAMAGGAGSSILEMHIYSWTPEEVRQELIEEVKKATQSTRNNRDVAKALRGQEKVGYAFLAGRQGYPIRYSRKLEQDGKTRIVLATDRPVSFGEVYSQSQLGDFDVTVVLLDVDESGNGQGVLSVGTEVKWDDSKDSIVITNVSSQPVKLTGVKQLD